MVLTGRPSWDAVCSRFWSTLSLNSTAARWLLADGTSEVEITQTRTGDTAYDNWSLETGSLNAPSERQDCRAIDAPVEHYALEGSGENGKGGGESDGVGHDTLIRDLSTAVDDLASSPQQQCYRNQPDVGNLSTSHKGEDTSYT